VVLRINSPGGSPVQAGIVNDEIYRLKALHKKKVYAVVEEVCAPPVGTEEEDPAARDARECARRLFVECALDPDFPSFITLPAYQEVLAREGRHRV